MREGELMKTDGVPDQEAEADANDNGTDGNQQSTEDNGDEGGSENECEDDDESDATADDETSYQQYQLRPDRLNREPEAKPGGIWALVKSLLVRALFMYVFSLLLQRSRTPTQMNPVLPDPLNDTDNLLPDETAAEIPV